MTAQTPDRIVYQGKGSLLHSQPFSGFPSHRRFIQRSPTNERGYIATWEISDGRLYLKGFSGASRVCGRVIDASLPKPRISHNGNYYIQEIGLRDLFGTHATKVFADWYSGELVIPQGAMTEYVDVRFKSKYETYLMVSITNGVKMGIRNISHYELEEEQKEGLEGLLDELDAFVREKAPPKRG